MSAIIPQRARLRRSAWRRALTWTAALLLTGVLVSALWLGLQLGGSLPQLDGERPLAGLSAPVTIERDALGIPRIHGATRLDVARGLGFVHAQDRFFQMDLARRQAAGELAALIAAALSLDEANRRFRFRERARLVLARAAPEDRALAEAYAEGVNAGLAALRARPFEYLLLRARPAPWQPEDSVLLNASMFFMLQDQTGARESRRGLLFEHLPPAMFEFLVQPGGGEWDAPLLGSLLEAARVPGPEVLDLRRRPGSAAPAAGGLSRREAWPDAADGLGGSNNWAVAGRHTRDGAALVANDTHLGLGVPNIWYRAALFWSGPEGEARQVSGLTIPGAPTLIIGSNGHVAWGFTNNWADWTDLIVLEVDPERPDYYATPEGLRRFERRVETIEVNGGEPVELEVRDTIWGPVIDTDHAGRLRALRWVPLVDGGLGADFSLFDEVRTLDEAIERAARLAMPSQNVVFADRDGRIGWTITGRVPRRVGFDGRVPASWADGVRRWDGWLDPAKYPRVMDPPLGRVWTANARTVDGAWLALLGDGGYDQGARGRQIRDALLEIDAASPGDMLALQLDDRALFLERWRGLLLDRLTDAAIDGDPARAEFRRLVQDDWTGRASVDSAGYRLVRTFRITLASQVLGALTAPARKADPDFNVLQWRNFETPLWRLLEEEPLHLLHPDHASWEAQIVAAVDATIAALREEGAVLAERTWGERNTAAIQHPLSRALPVLGRWLDMPRDLLPGDQHMPRVQSPREGASQRMVVSPGREEHGILHMPAGQSGHPLSPFYRDAHRAWVTGEATPFLPGETVHTLVLRPAARRRAPVPPDGPALEGPAWRLLELHAGPLSLVARVEAADPGHVDEIARQIVTPVADTNSEVLVYFYQPGAHDEAYARVQWTPGGGYVRQELSADSPKPCALTVRGASYQTGPGGATADRGLQAPPRRLIP